jgi:MscS family membrane protein
MEVMEAQFMGVSVYQVGLAFGAVLAGYLARAAVAAFFRRARRLAEKTDNVLDDIVLNSADRPAALAMLVAGVWLGLNILPLPTEPLDFPRLVNALGRGFSVILVIWFCLRFIDQVAAQWEKKGGEKQQNLNRQATPIIRKAAKVFLVLLGGAMFLQNLGYSVGSLLAGLGLGGMAIALASKDTLANLFGAMAVFLDRPFEVGDWIEMGGVEGTVEEVNLRTTRVRTFEQSLITMPNANLTTQAIENWSRMGRRRIRFTLSLVYGTPPEKLQATIDSIRQLLTDNPDLHAEGKLVYLDELGTYSLNILVQCFTTATALPDYEAAKERLLFEVLARCKKQGVDLAFPTSTVVLNQGRS